MKKQLEMLIAVTAKEREIEQAKKDYENHKREVINMCVEAMHARFGCTCTDAREFIMDLIDEL